jgi:hypothetical protein
MMRSRANAAALQQRCDGEVKEVIIVELLGAYRFCDPTKQEIGFSGL